MELEKLMNHADYKKAKIYHFCGENFKKKANAAYLMGAYQIIVLKKTAKEAWKPLSNEKFVSYRDAMRGTCSYQCTVRMSDEILIDNALSRRTRMGH